MWLISFAAAALLWLLLSLLSLIRKAKGQIGQNHAFLALKKMPFGLAIFLLSMFSAVLALEKHQITNKIADILFAHMGSPAKAAAAFGFITAISANILNNIPMSVLFAVVLQASGSALIAPAAYAAIIGSNIGALISPSGALAGIMLLNILRDKDAGFSPKTFIKYLAPTALFALTAAILTLIFVLNIIP